MPSSQYSRYQLLATMVKPKEGTCTIASNDVILLVLGQTGSGKSTFINAVIGEDIASIGHDLNSHTTEIQPFACAHPSLPDSRIVLVDTPGFNDSWIDDRETLGRIVQWLDKACKPSVTFAGVIYLYEITQARHIPKPNFMTPTKLSNPEAAQNVILTTVKWNEVTPAIGEQRERELTENWSEMYKHGSQMARFNNTPESAKDVVGLILGRKLVTVGLIHQEFSRILGILPKQSLWSVFGGLLSTLFGRRRR